MSKKVKIPIEVQSLRGDGFHLFVTGKVEMVPVRMLIDTGASKTVFDKNFLSLHFSETKLQTNEQLTTGVGSNTLQSEITEIKNLQIGRLQIDLLTIAVLDLSHVNETYSLVDFEPISGVIGSDLLVAGKAVINFKKKTLRMKHPTFITADE